MLAETGDEAAVSVRAVADRVGITPPSIYLHFRDKNELIFQCCREIMRELTTEVLSAIEGLEDPAERLRVAARVYVRFGIENPEPYRITFMSPNHDLPEDFELADYEGLNAFEVLTLMVTEVMADGSDRPVSPAEAQMHGMGLWAAVHGVVSLMIAKAVEPIDFPWPDLDATIEHLLDVHLPAMTPPGSPAA